MDVELPTLDSRPCPSCGWHAPSQQSTASLESVDLNFIGRGSPQSSLLNWSICSQCQLEFVNSAPKESWYLQQYQDSGETDPHLDHLASQTALRLWREKLPSTPDSVLELGCGQGLFLNALKQLGLRVCGTEPNQRLRQMSPLLNTEILAPEKLPPDLRFQALSLQLSLEHLYNPGHILRVASRSLSDGAYLFLLYHSNRALPHRILGKKSPLYDVQHLQLFNPESLENFLRLIGFHLLHDEPYANDYPFQYWARLLGFNIPILKKMGNLSWKAGNRVAVAQFQRKT